MSNDSVDDLASVDVTPLDELTRLKSEIETLDARLQAMEERKSSVAEAVYKRVRGDYETKRRELEQESAPLKAAARAQYVKLFALLSKSEADHEAARLDREEVEFRHTLGEFDDAEFKRRLTEIDEKLAARAAARERALEVRARFVAAFKSEDDLRQSAAPAAEPEPPAPAPAVSLDTTLPPSNVPSFSTPPPMPAVQPSMAATVRMTPLGPEQLAAAGIPTPVSNPVPPVPPPNLDSAATQTMRVFKPGGEQAPAAAPRTDQTVVIRGARLVPQNAEAGKITHTVGLKPVIVGSGENCDVKVPGALAQHAEIRVSMAGYTVSDLGGGVRINGVAVEQHLMRHDDSLEIGPARFAFREG